jgi:hypothetical protein
MQMSLSKSECRALLRHDLYAFIEQCFCELNPTTTFKPNWHLEMLSSALEGTTIRPTRPPKPSIGSNST